MDLAELVTTGVAVGGAGIGRDADGRVVFVEGALVGERVRVEITETKKSFRRGHVLDVIGPADGRIVPTCPEVANGCGGCDLAHAAVGYQHDAKIAMVSDALRRLGRLDEVPSIGLGPSLPSTGFRTTIRAGVINERAGLRRRRSHDLLPVVGCEVAHPLVEALLVDGRYGDADEVTIRVGARTGERMVVTNGDPSSVRVPDDVLVVAAGAPGAAWIHEEVAGRRFRISPRSFFQTRADGADALIEVVDAALEHAGHERGGTLADLCSGVGLFSATIGATRGFGRVVAIESNRSAVADAHVNLAHLGEGAEIVSSTFERWAPTTADVVIADPSRAGLAAEGVANVVATGAATVVLVSCDAGSLGRDAGLLVGHGYELDQVTLVDLFPNTAHVEVVSLWRSQTSKHRRRLQS